MMPQFASQTGHSPQAQGRLPFEFIRCGTKWAFAAVATDDGDTTGAMLIAFNLSAQI